MKSNKKIILLLFALLSTQTLCGFFLSDSEDEMEAKRYITPIGGTPAAIVTPSCSAGITRIKNGNGAPSAWATQKGLSTAWVDVSFTSTNYLNWAAPYTSGYGAALIP